MAEGDRDTRRDGAPVRERPAIFDEDPKLILRAELLYMVAFIATMQAILRAAVRRPDVLDRELSLGMAVIAAAFLLTGVVVVHLRERVPSIPSGRRVGIGWAVLLVSLVPAVLVPVYEISPPAPLLAAVLVVVLVGSLLGLHRFALSDPTKPADPSSTGYRICAAIMVVVFGAGLVRALWMLLT